MALCLGAAWPAWAATAAGRAEDPIQSSPALAKIRDAGVITLGYRDSSPPFSYLDRQRQPIGYSIDICLRVVDEVRRRLAMPTLDVRLMAVSSATRLPLLANGTVDLECGVTTNTAERNKSVAFSVTTFVAASRLMVRPGSSIRGLEDLRGQPVATTVATTSIQFLHTTNESRQLGMKILAGLDDLEAFRLLATGRAVAFAMDDVLLKSMIATQPEAAAYQIVEEPLTVEPYAIGLRRDDAVFKRLVDGVIVDLFRSGAIHALYRNWFQSPIPPKGINLQMPMSEALKRVVANPTDASDPRLYR
ncbi:amino acid ABC transporter substrate-binding protein [Ideonella livida]|uniref:Amino acid ABC transporter substrate-binding protein n=1 Tax=Ideonella livida TaxID=2707176 RepID=A0A7C9PIW2_9BURK|nr:amino acid ABC transporter substrate-binding protein [Ideonella livida]NDY93036.1 amino acid ABC transporter substrate-binding protein [Ideonella livida]